MKLPAEIEAAMDECESTLSDVLRGTDPPTTLGEYSAAREALRSAVADELERLRAERDAARAELEADRRLALVIVHDWTNERAAIESERDAAVALLDKARCPACAATGSYVPPTPIEDDCEWCDGRRAMKKQES